MKNDIKNKNEIEAMNAIDNILVKLSDDSVHAMKILSICLGSIIVQEYNKIDQKSAVELITRIIKHVVESGNKKSNG